MSGVFKPYLLEKIPKNIPRIAECIQTRVGKLAVVQSRFPNSVDTSREGGKNTCEVMSQTVIIPRYPLNNHGKFINENPKERRFEQGSADAREIKPSRNRCTIKLVNDPVF